jgi:hypothetical protein
MAHPTRRQMLQHGAEELRVSPRIMLDPMALFERSFDIADAYEDWLEAQAQVFAAMYWFSTASLGLFRALSGKGGGLPGRAMPRAPARQGAPPRQAHPAPARPTGR